MDSHQVKRWLLLVVATGAFIWIVKSTEMWESALRFLFPGENQVLHPRGDLAALVMEHVKLVALSSTLTVLLGMPLGICVTRSAGRDFLPIASSITLFGQTFSPVAVLALVVPVLGFGLLPTVVALFLYGLLPVVHNTIAGLWAVPVILKEAAYGMGMSSVQVLLRVEIPLASRVIMAGVMISVIINIGTAMIGAVIGAGGLGSPIMAGLVQDNLAFILEGAVPAAMLAILADQLLSNVEGHFVPATSET